MREWTVAQNGVAYASRLDQRCLVALLVTFETLRTSKWPLGVGWDHGRMIWSACGNTRERFYLLVMRLDQFFQFWFPLTVCTKIIFCSKGMLGNTHSFQKAHFIYSLDLYVDAEMIQKTSSEGWRMWGVCFCVPAQTSICVGSFTPLNKMWFQLRQGTTNQTKPLQWKPPLLKFLSFLLLKT